MDELLEFLDEFYEGKPRKGQHCNFIPTMSFAGMGAGGGGPSNVSVVFTDESSDTADTTSYSFASQSFGDASSTRQIVICVALWRPFNAGSISSLTVGGVSASLVKAQGSAGEVGQRVEMWSADVPTGTTGTVVVTTSVSFRACAIGVFALYGADSTANDTGGDSSNSVGSAVMTDTINIPENGGLIGCAMQNNNSASFTWDYGTEEYDAVFDTDGNGASHSGIGHTVESSVTGQSVSCTASNSNGHAAMAMASWGVA